MNKLFLLPLIPLLLIGSVIQAQCMLVNVPLTERVDQSVLIVEGKIVGQRSFWDDNRHNIFTANKIEVYKSFKGLFLGDHVELITRGGAVGYEMQKDYPSLQVNKGDIGIFLLVNNRENLTSSIIEGLPIYAPATGPQGFIKYDLLNGTASDVLNNYDDITSDLYHKIKEITEQNYKKIIDFDVHQIIIPPNPTRMMSITNFSPSTVTAGTDVVLTITGTGFGAPQEDGFVQFSNADEGGNKINTVPLEDEYCSWSDTEIKVHVPPNACTGIFEVVPDGGSPIASPTALTVTYSQLNVRWPSPTPTNTYQTQHINDDGNGGYTWQRNTDFANGPAAAPFGRALNKWCNSTNINWRVGANTSTNVAASDGINVATFDTGGPLPGGVLGRCTSRWGGCGTGSSKNCETGIGTPAFQWHVIELDIVFNDNFTWHYEETTPPFTPTSAYDFESVAVHELGHGHQLGHVKSTAGVMYYAIANNTAKRTPSGDEISGATDVYNRSTTSAVCGGTLMGTGVNCASLLLPVELIAFTAKKQDRSVVLHWSTASEIDNDYFLLERSVEGRPFETIGQVSGAGYSNEVRNYHFTDEEPPTGSIYYRLKQVDYDGSFEYSKARSVRFDIEEEEISVYPNPVNGSNMHISFSSPKASDLGIQLIDVNGVLLLEKQQFLEKGVQKISIPLEGIPSGVYWLRLNYWPNSYVRRIVKI